MRRAALIQTIGAIKMEFNWRLVAEDLPPETDEYYLFGGRDESNNFTYEKYHYSRDGLINGWTVSVAIRLGNMYWCKPVGPKLIR